MKKLILTLLFLLLSCPAFAENQQLAWMGPVIVGSGSGSISCGSTPAQSETTEDSYYNFASGATTLNRATKVTYSGTTGTLCGFDANIACETTDCVQVLTGRIYAHNSGDNTPGTLLGTCTGTYDTTPLGTTNTWVSFTGCSVSVENGTVYWIAINSDTYNATNKLRWAADSTCATERNAYAGEPPTWTVSGTTDCTNFKLYILE